MDAINPPQQSTRRVIWIELVVVFFLAVLPHMLNTLAPYGNEETVPVWLDSMLYSVISLQILAPLIYIIWRSVESPAFFGIVKPRLGAECLLAIPICLAGWFLPQWFLLGIYQFEALHHWFWEFEGVYWESAALPSSPMQWGMIIVAYNLSAAGEEIAIRGFMLPRLIQLTNSRALAVLLSAFVFASYHIYQGLASTISIFVFGVIYAIAFLLIKRIWPLIIAHAAANVIMTIMATNGTY